MVITMVAAIDNQEFLTKFVSPVFITLKNEIESNMNKISNCTNSLNKFQFLI